MSEKARTLGEIAMRLNEESIRLRDAFDSLDQRLQALNLGVEVSVDLPRNYELSYGRTGNNKWGLRIKAKGPDNNYVRVRDAPRKVLMEVPDAIPALLDALNDKAAELTNELNVALDIAKKTLAALDAAGLPEDPLTPEDLANIERKRASDILPEEN